MFWPIGSFEPTGKEFHGNKNKTGEKQKDL